MGPSRLYKLLVKEQVEEVEVKKTEETSAFNAAKRTLWRSLSFTKVLVKNPHKTKSIEKQTCYSNGEDPWLGANSLSEGGDGHSSGGKTKQASCRKVLKRISRSFKHKLRDYKPNVIYKTDEVSDEDLQSTKDSAYFSFSRSCFNDSESSSLEDHLDENFFSENIDPLSKNKSFSVSPIPILTTSSLSRRPRGPNEPKKNVTLLLPKTRTREKPFGIHLQIEKVKTFFTTDYRGANFPHGDMSGQVIQLYHLAKGEMMEKFPSLSSTISILFSHNPKPILLSLSSSMIGDLLFHLSTVLFSPLLPILQSLDVVFSVIIRFLHQVSCLILQSVENCQVHDQEWLQLQDKWKDCFYSHKLDCLSEVRTLYVKMWCHLILAK